MSPVRKHFVANVNPKLAGRGKPPFSLDAEFHDTLSQVQQDAFEAAIGRWLKVLVAGGPPVMVGGEKIESLLIVAKCEPVDQKGGLSADTNLDVASLRGADAGGAAHLPGKATITLDVSDMKALDDAEAAGAGPGRPEAEQAAARDRIRRFRVDLMAHEIGHALGFSRTVWERKGLLTRNVATRSPVFTGAAARDAYGVALHRGATPVPLEPFGDLEKYISHWRQAIFHSELMTFLLEDNPNVIGPVTVAALKDLGYEVDPDGAETDVVDFSGRPAPVPGPPPVGEGQPVGKVRPPGPDAAGSGAAGTDAAGSGAAGPYVYPAHRMLRDRRWLNCRERVT